MNQTLDETGTIFSRGRRLRELREVAEGRQLKEPKAWKLWLFLMKSGRRAELYEEPRINARAYLEATDIVVKIQWPPRHKLSRSNADHNFDRLKM